MEAEQNSLNNKLEGWKHKVQVTFFVLWWLVLRGPGRASWRTSGLECPFCSLVLSHHGMCTVAGNLHCCLSELFVCSFESVSWLQLLDGCWDSVPQCTGPHTEELAPDLQPAILHCHIERVCCRPRGSATVSSLLEPCLMVQAPSTMHDFVHHVHVCLVLPLLQGL